MSKSKHESIITAARRYVPNMSLVTKCLSITNCAPSCGACCRGLIHAMAHPRGPVLGPILSRAKKELEDARGSSSGVKSQLQQVLECYGEVSSSWSSHLVAAAESCRHHDVVSITGFDGCVNCQARVSAQPQWRRSSSDAASFVAFLLQPGGTVDTWLATFGPLERRKLLDPTVFQPWLRAQDIVAVLSTALRGSGVDTPGGHSDLPHRVGEAARYLAAIIDQGGVLGALCEQNACCGGDGGMPSAEWLSWLNVLVSVPSVASNALRRAAPAALYPPAFFPMIASDFLAAVSIICAAATGAATAEPVLPPGLAALLHKLVRVGQLQPLAKAWVRVACVTGSTAVGRPWSSKWSLALLSALPAARAASALATLCEQMTASAALRRRAAVTKNVWAIFAGCGAPAVGKKATPAACVTCQPGTTIHTLWYRVLASASLSRRCTEALVGLVTRNANVSDTERVRAIEHMVRMWGSAQFSSNRNLPLQRGVTAVVLESLQSLPGEQLQSDPLYAGVLQAILAGVQLRFRHTDAAHRRLATRVAAAFSALVTPETALDFGDDSSDGTEYEEELVGSAAPATGSSNSVKDAVGDGSVEKADSVDKVANPAGSPVGGAVEEAVTPPRDPGGGTDLGVDLHEVVLGDSASEGYGSEEDSEAGSSSSSESDLEPFDMVRQK